jgi:hypothetical protein
MAGAWMRPFNNTRLMHEDLPFYVPMTCIKTGEVSSLWLPLRYLLQHYTNQTIDGIIVTHPEKQMKRTNTLGQGFSIRGPRTFITASTCMIKIADVRKHFLLIRNVLLWHLVPCCVVDTCQHVTGYTPLDNFRDEAINKEHYITWKAGDRHLSLETLKIK